jgi:hypothetical protein
VTIWGKFGARDHLITNHNDYSVVAVVVAAAAVFVVVVHGI